MFILVVVILISIYIITLEGVFPFITILSLSFIRLLINYNSYRDGNGRNGLIPGAVISPNIDNLDVYNPNTYNLPV